MTPRPPEPVLDAPLERRVRAVFDRAAAAEGPERARVLRQARATDPEACAEAEALLTHHDRAGLLDQSAAEAAAPLVGGAPADPAEVLPRRLGGFMLERVLGRGGMGVVYEARQEFPSRRVAVKLVRPEVVTPSLVRRFTQEAQTLALLQHDGIARLYQAGHAEGGAPFIVMELVEGRPITAWCEEQRLGLRERLELVARVCDAVEHAHRRGVIHRDLKPGNIFVDAGGNPKVLDFGVARLTERAPGSTAATLCGQVIGTLGYMSPEQVDGDQARIDTRTDVYALGAVLHELLTGKPPIDVTAMPLAQAAAALRDREPEPLGRTRPDLRGDVETIVARALQADPTRRYQSAADLGADLRRFLRGEPIEARRDSAMYLLQKRMKRYRWGIGAGAAFVVVIVLVAAWTAVMAGRYRDVAQREAEANSRLAAELRASNLERGRLLVSSGTAPEGEAMLWDEHLREPGDDSRWALRDTYLRFPCRATLDASDGELMTAVFTPAGGLITGGSDGAARVWPAAPAPPAPPAALTLSHDGEVVRSAAAVGAGHAVTGTDAGVVRLWSLTDGSLAAPPLRLSTGRAWVAASPDGALVAAGGAGGEVVLLDARTLEVVAELGRHPSYVHGVSFSPDGGRLASVSIGELRVWDALARTAIAAAPVERADMVCIAWSPDGLRLGAGTNTGRVRLFDAADLAPVGEITTEGAWTVRSVVFLPGGKQLAYCTWWSICIADAEDGAVPRVVGLSGQAISQVALDGGAGGTRLASAGEDGCVRVWDLSPDIGRRWWEPAGDAAGYMNVAAPAPDGQRIGVVNDSGVLTVFDAGGSEVARVPGPKVRPYDVNWSPDGRRIAWGGGGPTLCIIDTATWTLEREVEITTSTVNHCRFSPDGSRLATMATDGQTAMWSTADWTKLWSASLGKIGRMVRFAPGGDQVVATSSGGLMMFLDAANGSVLGERRSSYDYWGAAVDPLGRFVAIGNGERVVEVLDLRTHARVAALTGHQEVPWAAAFSDDGALLATASSNGTILVWDTATWRRLMSLRDDGHGFVFPMNFRPGTRRLLVGHGHRGVSEWDFASLDEFLEGNRQHHQQRVFGTAR